MSLAVSFAQLALWVGMYGAPAPSPVDPRFSETFVVSGSRDEVRVVDEAASTTVLDSETIARSSVPTLDEQLRQVPGLSLLRRSSSLSAHPTSQGISLRGLGASGASRTLVLLEGSPLNDPFGGWVYWNRVPPLALEKVEIARGSLSQWFGSAAMGGVIQLLPRLPEPASVLGSIAFGDRGTRDAQVFAADRSNGGRPWSWSLAGRAFETDGFFVLSPTDRGAVDRPAGVDFDTLYGILRIGGYHVSLNAFQERRNNGTALQRNETRLGSVAGGFDGSRWRWDVYGQRQRFDSTFSRVLPNRKEEFLTAEQDVRLEDWGGSASRRFEGGALIGGDLRRTSWTERRQTFGGIYFQDTWSPTSRLDFSWGARLDGWRSEEILSSFNPRLGLVYRASESVLLRASAYRGFRAPTLNELYRPFRVGNVETLNNPDLGEESLVGAELGVDLTAGSGLTWHANVFRNRLSHGIGNVTISVDPQRILRQRRNLDRIDLYGFESELSMRLRSNWQARASYLYSRARQRTGLRVPQVPEQQASLALAWNGPVLVSFQARGAGSQFEDDQNQLRLDPYLVADLSLRRNVHERIAVTLSIQNLFDEKVVTGRTPLENLGAPRMIQLGASLRLRGR